MEHRTRMSPLTALFLGIFGVVGVGLLSGTLVALYGMRIVDQKASVAIDLVDRTIDGLPELMASLPPSIGDLLNDRRAPDYARNIDVDVRLLADDDNTVRPALTVTNTGSEVVSLLAIRVAALNVDAVPVRDWTAVAATPVALDDDWPGVLMPGQTRHLVLHRSRCSSRWPAESLKSATEIADVRVWLGERAVQHTSHEPT